MRRVLGRTSLLVTLGAQVLIGSGSAAADPMPGPPYIDHAVWKTYSGLSSLRVFPTKAGRVVAADIAKTAAQTDEAWREVVSLAADADTPGMRAQFICHWNFAEIAEPGKTSWNLEPWRPVVDDNAMMAAGCNPGGSSDQRF